MSPARRSAVADLAAAVLARRMARPMRIAIDGRTASGKTTLSAELADVLRLHGPVITAPLDGFHRPRAQRWVQGRAARAKANSVPVAHRAVSEVVAPTDRPSICPP